MLKIWALPKFLTKKRLAPLNFLRGEAAFLYHKTWVNNYLVTRSLCSHVCRDMVHFSGKARKMNHFFSFLRE
ncbi:MAG: hypothetical protein U5L45_24390 [Saprospiraceae bacterium]|nr:hypothetical protein [Saprospiraceae bacterium]